MISLLSIEVAESLKIHNEITSLSIIINTKTNTIPQYQANQAVPEISSAASEAHNKDDVHNPI